VVKAYNCTYASDGDEVWGGLELKQAFSRVLTVINPKLAKRLPPSGKNTIEKI